MSSFSVGSSSSSSSSGSDICLPETNIRIPTSNLITFQFNDNGIQQVVFLFSDPPNNDSSEAVNAEHKKIYQHLQLLEEHPEFDNYLAYIFAQLKSVDRNVRSRAGLRLKGRIERKWNDFDPSVKEYIKQQALIAVVDADPVIRNINGAIFTSIAQADGGAEKWPGLLKFLVDCIQSNHAVYMDSAFQALTKICEDLPLFLQEDAVRTSSLTVILPVLLPFLNHSEEDMRKHCLTIYNVFLPYMPKSMEEIMDHFLPRLFQCASSSHRPEVIRRICQAFCTIAESRFECFNNVLDDLIKFMLQYTGHENESLALQACEFWMPFCENADEQVNRLRPYLVHLVPTLLKAMRYTPMELHTLGDGDDDRVPDAEGLSGGNTHIADKAEDIRPAHFRPRSGDDDDDLDDEEEASTFTLRKCAAAAMDTLSRNFGNGLLEHLLQPLNDALNTRGNTREADENVWLVRESGILALGAIAEGCLPGMKQHLPGIVQFLLVLLRDSKPLVRSITCWTLTRYSVWIVNDARELRMQKIGSNEMITGEELFKHVLIELLKRVVDNNKKVQEAACSAFGTLEEEAGERLVPYLPSVVGSLVIAFNRYQYKNLRILYGTIGTLAESVREYLQDPECVKLLMPPLIQRWNETQDDEPALLPLLECLTAVAHALGMAFAPYAQKTFVRAITIIHTTLTALQMYHANSALQNENQDEPNQEFIVVALDLLSGLAEGLQKNIEPLLTEVGDSLVVLLLKCMQSSDPDVRQSSFALLGDLSKFCIGYVRPHLDKFLPFAARNLNVHFNAVCNNASWAIGEISIKSGSELMAPHIDMLMSYVVPLMKSSSRNNKLMENAAITLGRLGLVCPKLVAPYLPNFAQNWCEWLSRIRDRQEKEHAYQGLAYLVANNWNGMLPHFPFFAHALTTFLPNPELYRAFFEILHTYKNNLGANWPTYVAACDEKVQKHLIEMYKLQ